MSDILVVDDDSNAQRMMRRTLSRSEYSEYRDNETGAHIKRMSQYSAAIAQKTGLGKKADEAIL